MDDLAFKSFDSPVNKLASRITMLVLVTSTCVQPLVPVTCLKTFNVASTV